MTYSTLMVHLDGGCANASALDITATLAKQFDAKVIGVAACEPVQLAAGDGCYDGDFAVIERDIVDDELARCKVEFHAHAELRSHVLEWRSVPTLENITLLVAEEARCADLIVTGVGPAHASRWTHADAGELVLRAGRPVLVVPDAKVTGDFRTVVVAWTDTRESRRAVSDALPLLHRAERVIIVEAGNHPIQAGDGIRDIVAWLKRHHIDSDRINSRLTGSRSETLAAIADEVEADLVVAGAFGHSRIREWAFGGVTRDLLLHERRCTVLSH